MKILKIQSNHNFAITQLALTLQNQHQMICATMENAKRTKSYTLTHNRVFKT